MTTSMAWLLVAAFAVLLCAIGGIADNLGAIVQAVGDWLFDVQTAYYKFKQHRKNKQYLNTRKETKL